MTKKEKDIRIALLEESVRLQDKKIEILEECVSEILLNAVKLSARFDKRGTLDILIDGGNQDGQ